MSQVREETSTTVVPAYAGLEVQVDGKLMIIRFNVPKRRNAITNAMYKGLSWYLEKAANDPKISIVALTGNGSYYSSGNDFGSLFGTGGGSDSDEGPESGMQLYKGFVDTLIDFPKPIIGVVNGPAVGIAVTTLALMDAVYATDNAWLLCPFTRIGLAPEGCSSVTFPRIMGPQKASELLLFNKTVTTAEACELGLVTKVFPDASFQAEVWPKLKEWSELPTHSLLHAKKLCRDLDRDLLHKVNNDESDCLKELTQSEETINALLKNMFSKKSKL